MKKIEIEIPEGKEVKWVNGVLTLVDVKPLSIIDKVKTFEDACDILGKDHYLVKAFNETYNMVEAPGIDALAYMELRIISAALNEEWVATEHINEQWWFPWFYRFDKNSESKYDAYVLARSYSDSAAVGGVACAYACYGASYTYSSYGSRLALKSNELAEYCGKQFIQLWADYLLG